MPSTLRRFEILLPLQFNDGRDVPHELLADAVLEVVDHFGAISYYDNLIRGHWKHEQIVYRDNLKDRCRCRGHRRKPPMDARLQSALEGKARSTRPLAGEL